MERDTLIKVFALGMVIFFVVELFSTRSAVTSTPQQTNQTSNETPVYGAGAATATLMAYTNYLNLFKSGTDLSRNASIGELSSIAGVGFVNNQSGGVTLVLDNGANVSLVAQKVKERFPDVNVTALALFSIPSDVVFTTQNGSKNVSIPFLLQIETEPNLDIGDNVTVSLSGILQGDQLASNPIAKIIPTQMDVSTTAVVSGISDQYVALIVLSWEMRNVNVSMIAGEFPATMRNVSVNYTPNSYVAVTGLNSAGNDTIGKISKLSYVTEVNGDIVYVRNEMNSSEKLAADLKGILGGNATLDYPVSIMSVQFSSENFSMGDILKPTGGELLLYRKMSLALGDSIKVGGVGYEVPANTTFDSFLNSSYSVGKNISVELGIGTMGKRIVSISLKNLLS